MKQNRNSDNDRLDGCDEKDDDDGVVVVVVATVVGMIGSDETES